MLKKTVANLRIEGYYTRLGNHYLSWFFYTKEGGSMVSLTDGAVSRFKEVVEKQGTAGDGVRIFVVPGG